MLARYSLYAWIAWIIKDGITQIVTHSPEQIGAVTVLLRAFAGVFIKGNMHVWFSWAISGILLISWYCERQGKKRAIKELGTCRKQIEGNDPGGRSTSGLSETGDTPKG